MKNDDTKYEIETIGLFDENKNEIKSVDYKRQHIALVRGKTHIINSNNIQFKRHIGDIVFIHSVGLFDKTGKLIVNGPTEEVYPLYNGDIFSIHRGWVEVTE